MRWWLADKGWYLTFWAAMAIVAGFAVVRIIVALDRISRLLEELVRAKHGL